MNRIFGGYTRAPMPKVPPLRIAFFGRIRRAELACPNCGSVQSIGVGRSNWNHTTSRFNCQDCHVQYDLGIVAWPPNKGGPIPPPDVNQPLVPKQESPVLAGFRKSMVLNYLRRTKSDPVNIDIANLDPNLERLFNEADAREELPWEGTKAPLHDK